MADSLNTIPLPENATFYIPGTSRTCNVNNTHKAPPGLSSDGYAMRLNGDCLEPLIHDGELVAIEPITPKDGDLAILHFKNASPLCKRIARAPSISFPLHPESTVVEALEFQQINPPKSYVWWADRFEVLHTVRFVLRDGDWLDAAGLLKNWDKQYPQQPRVEILVPVVPRLRM